ncbi:MAG: hypothetical protein L6Q57_09375 [Alphaproteobacteria bacterium]|nr:hypothetical protein [Alphaproteobacteria bacterium]
MVYRQVPNDNLFPAASIIEKIKVLDPAAPALIIKDAEALQMSSQERQAMLFEEKRRAASKARLRSAFWDGFLHPFSALATPVSLLSMRKRPQVNNPMDWVCVGNYIRQTILGYLQCKDEDFIDALDLTPEERKSLALIPVPDFSAGPEPG